MAQRRLLQRGAKRADRFLPGGAGGTGLQVAFEFQAVDGIKFAIDVGVEQPAEVSAIHTVPFRLNESCNCRRARARRDMTVPTGTAATSAISLYERPSSSRSTSASRNSSGKVSSAARKAPVSAPGTALAAAL